MTNVGTCRACGDLVPLVELLKVTPKAAPSDWYYVHRPSYAIGNNSCFRVVVGPAWAQRIELAAATPVPGSVQTETDLPRDSRGGGLGSVASVPPWGVA